MHFVIDDNRVALGEASAYSFQRRRYTGLTLAEACRPRVEATRALVTDLLEKNAKVYGVTTGFGDSVRYSVDPAKSDELQRNLVAYLMCGTGKPLPRPAVRAMCVSRLVSLSRGHSGVSWELLEQMRALLAHDLMPIVPAEGSLGASGDLVPLAYLGAIIQGEGMVSTPTGEQSAAAALKSVGLKPYTLKPKEGLALVNGTSAMTGMAMLNLAQLELVVELAETATAWLCMSLGGRVDAFGTLVNAQAKLHDGQREAAERILGLLTDERYQEPAGGPTDTRPIQDRYSLRCAPQILGPVRDTVTTVSGWVERELNSVSDNPLFDAETGKMAMGGNFYGGYLGHGMDYFKVCAASVADMLDRQLMLLFDSKTSAGLPPNLADWESMRPEDRHLHHGLKGLHQVTNALTSEICSMAMPTTVFSRSSECHNQDKVSLGLSASVACDQMLEKVTTVCALHLSCLAQALELRGIKLRGDRSRGVHDLVRKHVPFVSRDQALGPQVGGLAAALRELAVRRGTIW